MNFKRTQALVLRLIAVFLALGFSGMAELQAQVINADRNVTTDSLHPNRPKGLLSFSASADKQRRNLVDVSSSADFSFFLPKRIVAVFLAKNDLTTNGSELVQNAGMLHLRFRDNDSRTIYPELFTQFQWNGVLGMEGRFLIGGNARWKFIHESEHDLFFGLGMMSETEKWNNNGVPAERLSADLPPSILVQRLRLNQYVKWAWRISPKTDFVFFNFLQAPSDSPLQPRLASHLELNFTPSSFLGFSVVLDSMYDTRPVVPIDRFYYSLKGAINLNI
jgi:hypothetical protein